MLYNYLGTDAETLATNETGDERERIARILTYQAEHPTRTVYHDWEPFEHPTLGPVEIGGLNRTSHANPPPGDMPDVATAVTDFAVAFARYHPELELHDASAAPIGDDVYRLTATVVNTGRLPTNLTEQGRDTRTHISDRPRITISADQEIEVVTGRQRQELGHLDAQGGRETLVWVVKAASDTIVDSAANAARSVGAEARIRLP